MHVALLRAGGPGRAAATAASRSLLRLLPRLAPLSSSGSPAGSLPIPTPTPGSRAPAESGPLPARVEAGRGRGAPRGCGAGARASERGACAATALQRQPRPLPSRARGPAPTPAPRCRPRVNELDSGLLRGEVCLAPFLPAHTLSGAHAHANAHRPPNSVFRKGGGGGGKGCPDNGERKSKCQGLRVYLAGGCWGLEGDLTAQTLGGPPGLPTVLLGVFRGSLRIRVSSYPLSLPLHFFFFQLSPLSRSPDSAHCLHPSPSP